VRKGREGRGREREGRGEEVHSDAQLEQGRRLPKAGPEWLFVWHQLSTRCGAQHSVRAALRGSSVTWVDMVPPNGWEIVLRKSRLSVGLNYGPIFHRSWTKVHQIMSADAGEIVVCNTVFQLSISCSVPEIFAIEVWSRPKSRQKRHVSRPQFFRGRTPNFWT